MEKEQEEQEEQEEMEEVEEEQESENKVIFVAIAPFAVAGGIDDCRRKVGRKRQIIVPFLLLAARCQCFIYKLLLLLLLLLSI